MTEIERKMYRIYGMDCASCASSLEKRMSALPGVSEVEVSFPLAKMSISYLGKQEHLLRAVKQAGYAAEEQVLGEKLEERSFWRNHPKVLTTLLAAVFFVLGLIFISAEGMPAIASILTFAAAIGVGGYRIAMIGITGLKSRNIGIELLMTIAVAGAMAIGEWTEGAAVIVLFSLGETLEAYTMDRTRKSIRSIMQLAPSEAVVLRDGQETSVSVDDVRIGDTLVIRPGEKIAMDGIVLSGNSSVNQAPITGESIPVEKISGDTVFAGTINQQGSIEVKVRKLAKDNTISRIIQMVEEAQSQKAPSQRFVDRFAKYYTPAVIVIAIFIAVVPPLLFSQEWGAWFYRALVTLVVACPCALVISTPVSIVSAIGNAARHGVLIKGGAHLERLGAIAAIAFDKTGTLTLGVPTVKHVEPIANISPTEMILLAASVESRSEHPLAMAMLRYASDQGIDWPACQNFGSYTGKGAVADVNERRVYIGNPALFVDTLGVNLGGCRDQIEMLQQEGNTVVLLGEVMSSAEVQGQHTVKSDHPSIKLLGVFAIRDEIRRQSRTVVERLHRVGIKHIYMLTGDNEGTARAISREIGDQMEYRAELMPEDKATVIEVLQEELGSVAMVGDGVNDAPAMAVSTVGIAMGTAGTDTALETADIALMADDLNKIPYTVKLSRRTVRIILQNIVFSLVLKAVFLILIIPGWITLWMAVAADVGASILVILNGMRLLRTQSDFEDPEH